MSNYSFVLKASYSVCFRLIKSGPGGLNLSILIIYNAIILKSNNILYSISKTSQRKLPRLLTCDCMIEVHTASLYLTS